LVACPCTFALATPLIFSRAIAALAQERVYTKSPDALERIAESRTIWFDKTGTLTQGKLKLIEVTESQNPEEHLRIAASLEKISRHPISRAILTAAEVEDVGSLFYVDAHKEIRGLGIEGKINGNAYLLGKPSKERAASNGAAISQDVRTEIDLLENGLPIARFSLGDSIKPEAYNLIRNLKNRGYKVGILSGDSQQTVDDLAQALGFPTSNCFGNLTPENKKHYLVQQDHPLFIGDGANDLLALSVSHASIALHTGIEASLKIADFACLSSSLHSIERILLTGDRTKKALRITLLISLLYNLCAITAAILGWVTPLFAAILMPCASTLTLLSGYLTTRDLIFSHETRQEKI
jgi:Cu2+-exporting ATPase